MTPCVPPRSEVTVEYLSKPLIVSRGSQNSSSKSSGRSLSSQSSGSSTSSLSSGSSASSQSQPSSLRGGTMQKNMERL
jgi:hypothetical protein